MTKTIWCFRDPDFLMGILLQVLSYLNFIKHLWSRGHESEIYFLIAPLN